MWKLNGNFHSPQIAGATVKSFSNVDGSPVTWTDTSPTDRIYHCDRVATTNDFLVFNLRDKRFHVYLEEGEDEKKG